VLVDDLGFGPGISSPVHRERLTGGLEASPARFEAGK